MTSDPEHAKSELKIRGIEPTQESFEKQLKNAGSDTISLFIQSGVNPDAADSGGYTPLMNAVMFGNADAVSVLLNHHVRVNAQNRYGKTALMMAVIANNKDIAEQLLQKGAEPNLSSSTGETPLFLAVKNGNIDLLTLLLKKGASPAYTEKDMNPIDLAKKLNKKEVLELLLTVTKEKEPVDETPLVPESPVSVKISSREFHNLIASGETDRVKELLEHGQNPDSITEKGYTPLITAASFDKSEIIDHLIARKPKLNFQNRNGYTALHVAVIGNNQECVEKLLSARLDPNIESVSGDTALIKAMMFQNKNIIEMLLKHGAETDIINNDGYTALSLAVMKKSAAIVSLLLAHGADKSIASKGQTPLQRSQRIGATDIIDILSS